MHVLSFRSLLFPFVAVAARHTSRSWMVRQAQALRVQIKEELCTANSKGQKWAKSMEFLSR
jgi:hypothetical protein